jgi:hypothetical protein
MKVYTPTLDDDNRHRYVVDVWDKDEYRYMPILVTCDGTEARKRANDEKAEGSKVRIREVE